MPAGVDQDDVDQRIVEAAAVLPEVGGITGWASLRWLGGEWFDGLGLGGRTLPVDLATCYADIRSQHGFVVHQERLGPRELIMKDGLRSTLAVRSLCFMMRYARDIRQAVTFADLAMYSDLVSLAELSAYCLAHPGWTGIPLARDALPLVDENSWSPWETWMRLVWVREAGFCHAVEQSSDLRSQRATTLRRLTSSMSRQGPTGSTTAHSISWVQRERETSPGRTTCATWVWKGSPSCPPTSPTPSGQCSR